MTTHCGACTAPMYTVRLTGGPTRHTQWSYFTENPQGGGFGSNAGAGRPRHAALTMALRGLPSGTLYRLVINDREEGTYAK